MDYATTAALTATSAPTFGLPELGTDIDGAQKDTRRKRIATTMQ